MNRGFPTSRAAVSTAARQPMTAVGQVLAVLAMAALTALGARLSVPLPGIPVPMTLQTAAVLLSGVLLGGRLGAASQLTYVAAGLAGLPVFAAGGGAAYLLGPTGGYLLAFPLAALVAGRVVRRESGVLRTVGGLVLALAVIHAGGLAWLGFVSGYRSTLAAALAPFLVGDALEVALVVLILRGAGRLAVRRTV